MLSLLLCGSAFMAPSSVLSRRGSLSSALMMAEGTAMRWNAQKGFGFIAPEDGGDDIFCHFSAIEDGGMLKEGAKVTFVKVFDEAKGKERAEQVTGGSPREDEAGGAGGRGGEIRGGVTGEAPAGMMQGKVKGWNPKGFGFIVPDAGGDELFCHFSSITDGNTLSPGAIVHYAKEFDEQRGNDRAAQVIGGYQEEWRGGGGGGGGGGRGGGSQERRTDSDGSGPYTKQEFLDEYGNYDAWDAAGN